MWQKGNGRVRTTSRHLESADLKARRPNRCAKCPTWASDPRLTDAHLSEIGVGEHPRFGSNVRHFFRPRGSKTVQNVRKWVLSSPPIIRGPSVLHDGALYCGNIHPIEPCKSRPVFSQAIISIARYSAHRDIEEARRVTASTGQWRRSAPACRRPAR